MMTRDNYTCNKCGTVAFKVTRKYAEAQSSAFRDYYDSLTEEQRESYYGGKRPVGVRAYERCACGNPNTNFRKAVEGDCPKGCTLSPIIVEE